ncbi:MAG: glycoside hydrolase family 15 protein [Bdellovibrionota bacterium]
MSWETRPPGEVLLGNGRLLTVLDGFGEIDQLFSPHIDALQGRLSSFRTHVLIPHPSGSSPEMIVVGPDAFDIRLHLMNGGQILKTEYHHKSRPLKLIRTLAIHPVDACLLDSWQVLGESAGLIHSSVPWMGTATAGHCSLYHPIFNGLVHHRGRRWLAIVGRKTAHWVRVGHLPESDRRRMWDGEKVWVPVGAGDLHGYPGQPVVMGWDHVVQGPATFGALAMPPVNAGECIDFFIVGAESEASLHTLLQRTRLIETPRFVNMVERFSMRNLDPAMPLLSKIQNPHVQSLAQRSIEVLLALQDGETGALIAAAEADPHSRVSGGYGYSWPRDGAYLASALGAYGYRDRVEKYFEFLKNTQDLSTGAWFQRYLATGHAGPSWGRIQIDEPATVIGAAWMHYRNTQDLYWLERIWPTIKLGLNFLEEFHGEKYPMGQDSHDLWEERMGVHAYSLAAVIAAFMAGAYMAGELANRSLQQHYHSIATRLNRLLRENFVVDGGPIRRSWVADGRGGHWWDETPDVSMLGLIAPFGVLHRRDPVAGRILNLVHERLWAPSVGGIYRYIGDTYRGGNPWILTTLWLAIVDLSLGRLDQARESFQWAMSKTTPLGMFAEQVHKETGRPFWVIPLGWSHAMYLLFVRDVIRRGVGKEIWG